MSSSRETVASLPEAPGRPRFRTALALLAAAALLGGTEAGGTALPIMTDGYVDDWTVGPVYMDPEGDNGTSNIDFRNLWVAEDDDWLFIRFDTTIEIHLQDGTNLALYLDTDANSSTGVSVGGIGAELRWQFGDCGPGCYRRGTFYGNPPPRTFYWYNADIRIGPTTTGTQFEFAVARDARPDGVTPLFSGDHIRVLLRDEAGDGDRLPDDGDFVDYTFTNEGLPPEPPNDLTKLHPDHVRMMTWNVLFDGPWDGAKEPSFERIMQAIDPEIIAFQEIFTHSAAQTRVLVESWLPSGPGESWTAFKNNDCVTVSRFPFSGIWNIGANLAMLLETQDRLGRKLLVINAHLPCCDDDAGRQQEADQIMAFVRDAISPGGSVTVDSLTAIVITGDMNLIGYRQQLTTMLTGDIVNEATYGPDFNPDWDGTALTDLVSPLTEERMPHTYWSEPDFQGDNPPLPSRIDMHLYTDSVLGPGNHFIIFTPRMSPDQLALLGLNADDSLIATDHLPHVTDLFDGTTVAIGDVEAPIGPPRVMAMPNPMRSLGSVVVEVDRAATLTVGVFDVAGRQLRWLSSPAGVSVAPGRHAFTWDGRTDAGIGVPSGVYLVRIDGAAADGRAIRRSSTVTVVR